MVSFAGIAQILLANIPKVLEQISKLLCVEVSAIAPAEILLGYIKWIMRLPNIHVSLVEREVREVFAFVAPLEVLVDILPNVDRHLCHGTELDVL